MSRPHLITKLIFAALGIYLLMRSLGQIGSAAVMLNRDCLPEAFTARMFVTAAEGIIILTASLILLFRSAWLERMVMGPDANHHEIVDSFLIIAAFRMMVCFCGLLILYNRIRLLFYYVPTIIKGSILSYLTLEGQSSQLSSKTAVGIIVEITRWIIAIYLIFGAPHFVRWQIQAGTVKTRGEK